MLVQAYPYSLTLQWFDDHSQVCRCAIQLKAYSDFDYEDCIEAYGESEMATEIIVRKELTYPKINRSLKSCVQKFNEHTRYKTVSEAVGPVLKKEVPLKQPRVHQTLGATPATRDESNAKYFNLTGLSTCQTYDLTLLIVPETNDSSYSDELRGAATIVDDTIPPASLNCFITEDGLALSWGQPIDNCNVDLYIVSWTAESLWNSDSENNSSNVDDPMFSLSETLAYAEYNFQVIANYSAYDTSSAPAHAVCESSQKESSPPQNVTVLEKTSSSITLEWDPPSSANGLVESYQIDCFTKSSEENVSSITTKTTSGTISGLDPCTNYTFTVRAINGVGLGQASDAVTDFTISEENLNLVCASEESKVSLSWNEIYYDCIETQYFVQYNYSVLWNGDSKNSDVQPVTYDHSFSLPEADVFPGTQYDIAVTTEGNVSDHCSLTTDDAKSSAPSITLISSTSTSIYMEWSAPTEANGLIQGYNVSYQEVTCDACEIQSSTVEKTFTNITELQPCSNYNVQVSAVNGAGSGDVDARDTSTQFAGPTSISCHAQSSSEILVEWEGLSPDCASAGYTLEWEGTSLWEADTTFSSSQHLNDPSPSYVVSDLHPYTRYTVCLRGDQQNEQFCCNCTTMEAKSSAPNIVQLDATSVSVYVAWLPPAEANGIITGYKVTYFEEGFGDNFSVLVDGEVNESNTTENVVSCTNYTVEVAAVNGFGEGDFSTDNVKTLPVPGAPPKITCVVQSSSEVLVFSNETDACYGPEYAFTWRGKSCWENGVFFNESSFFNGSADELLLVDLHPFTEYQICLQSQGSLYNDSCCVVTTNEAPPTEPQSFSITDVSSDSITLEWQEPESWNGIASGYVVTCEDEAFNTTSSTVMLTNLERGTTYNISVEACSGGGCGSPANVEGTTDSSEDKTILIVFVSLISVGIFITVVIVFIIKLKTKHKLSDNHDNQLGTMNSNGEFQFETFDELKKFATQKSWSSNDITATMRL